MKRPRSVPWLLPILLWLQVPEAAAQAAGDVKREARERFEAGLATAQSGDLTTALKAFEAAYAAQPHFSVLYNIGRARAGLGKHIEAIAAFERYLSDGGTQVAAVRREEVHSLLDASRKQVGAVKIVVAQPNAARVWLDGAELDPEQLSQPIQLAVGTHGLIHSIRGSAPIATTVNVRSSTITEVELAAPGLTGSVVEVWVRCNVPGVAVSINGALRGHTPLTAALSVQAGTSRIRFFRPGYRMLERELEIQANGSLVLDCEQHPQPTLSKEIAAHLEVSRQPPDADVFVNGKPFTGEPLPNGPHELSVTRDGFLPLTKRVSLSAGRTTAYAAVLEPTPRHEARRRAAIAHRQGVAYVLAGVGAALLAASAGVYAWNSNRYEDFRSRGEPDVGRAVSIQRVDDLVLGLVLGGVGLGTGGAFLHFSAPPGDP